MGMDTTRRRFLAVSGATLAAPVAGCQGSGNTETTASEQQTAPSDAETAVVSPATVKAWVDAGLVNSDPSEDGERVVILRVGDIDSYESGHLPGAFPWGTLHQQRLEALAPTSPLVPAGAVMDDLLQRSGVTEESTILLSGSNPMFAARGYWTLRYWGFPRQRIKVLDAGYSKYQKSYGLESGSKPDSPTSDFSVRETEGHNADLRVSLGEMIHRVDSINEGRREDVIIDQRSHPVATIATATVVPSPSYHEGTRFDSVAAWRRPDELESILFEESTLPESGPYITYCNTGYQGAMGFFVLDGLLQRDDVALYDGSFESQWKHYDAKAEPVPNDAWRVDIERRTDGHTGQSSLDIDPELNDALRSVTSHEANQVERADSAYRHGEPGTTSAR